VSSLTDFFNSDFNNQQEQWEKALLAELKISEVGNKATKKMLSGLTWPTLSLSANKEVQLPSSEWKKASTTYSFVKESEIENELTEDYQSGVRDFFFHPEGLDEAKLRLIQKTLADKSDVKIFVLEDKKFISGKSVHDQGAHSIQELAVMAKNLISRAHENEINIAVYVDSQFFHNIAKIRAAKLLVTKILAEMNIKKEFKIIALTSYTGWTVFERYSNMLRNETAVASAYVGGADHIQSSGYNTVFELEADSSVESDHVERSRRMARNTAHVLALESMLGVVEDAAFGSYHLESLTQVLCEESWKLMQEILSGKDITEEVAKVREQRLLNVKTRKAVMSGMNDYPDVKEHLKIKLKTPKQFRVSRAFEDLRLKMEGLNKPEVAILLHGEYGALNARLNFVKNYFELLGLSVHERLNVNEVKEDIVVLCSLDDGYESFNPDIKASMKFIAGKIEKSGYKNLFAGQNVYDVLSEIVSKYDRL
jgi:Methylmalonyl-CoA mutase